VESGRGGSLRVRSAGFENQTFEFKDYEAIPSNALVADLLKRSQGDMNLWIDLEEPDFSVFPVLSQFFAISEERIQVCYQGEGHPLQFESDVGLFRTRRVFYHFETESCSGRPLVFLMKGRAIVTLHPKTLSRTVGHVFSTIKSRGSEFLSDSPTPVISLLFDELIEDYKPVIEDWQDELDTFEQQAVHNPSEELLSSILRFKKLVTQLRHALNGEFRDQRLLLMRCPESLIRPEQRHQLEKSIASFQKLLVEIEDIRQHSASAYQVYAAALSLEMTRASNQMNRIMERLSVVTSVFMPLTFIVGVYGMNIPDIPELSVKGFYYFLWGLMVVLAGALLYLFKKLKWY